MYRDELTQIAQTVWESVLNMSLEPATGNRNVVGPATLTAVVSFTGAWSGHVTATLSESLGRRIAGMMLEAEPEELNREDVFDALREVINMLGGNVKALLPPPCQLSLPFVFTASGVEVSLEPNPLQELLHFECEQQAIEIALRGGPMLSTPVSTRPRRQIQ